MKKYKLAVGCVMPYSNAPEIVDGALRFATTHPTLKFVKALFPEYKELPSHTLQDVIARVEKTFERWLKGDSKGFRSGRPRFKGKGRYRSLSFPDPIKPEHLTGKFIQLPKIGKVKPINLLIANIQLSLTKKNTSQPC